MNTLMSFLYRDACNYKVHNEIIMEGEITEEQKNKILNSCSDGFFIPEQVGMPVTRFETVTNDDTCFCEIYLDDFSLTDKDPTVTFSIYELVSRFEAAGESGWDCEAFSLNPMKKFEFTTTVTMKEYNQKKWWIASDIISRTIISAKNMREALKEYQNHAEQRGIHVSENALRNKEPMYIDTKEGLTKQVGYVITGATDFDDNRKQVRQYVNLWVNIVEIRDVDFDE